MKYTDVDLFRNRIQCLDSIIRFCAETTDRPDLVLVCKGIHSAAELAENRPSVSWETGADKAVFESAKQLVDEQVFQVAGIYFQRHILDKFNGKNDVRKIAAYEAMKTLFRLSPKAGPAMLMQTTSGSMHEEVWPLVDLDDEALKLFSALQPLMGSLQLDDYDDYGTTSNGKKKRRKTSGRDVDDDDDDYDGDIAPSKGRRTAVTVTPSSSGRGGRSSNTRGRSTAVAGNGKGRGRKEESEEEEEEDEDDDEEEEEEEDDVDNWTESDPYVEQKTQVAKLFADPSFKGRGKKQMIPFVGTVIKFGPETAPGENDALWKILFEDGDKLDMDIDELKEGIALFKSLKSKGKGK